MKRHDMLLATALVALLVPASAGAQDPRLETKEREAEARRVPPPDIGSLSVHRAPQTKPLKIQNAMSAAPPAISKNATVMDFPAKEGDEMPVLRNGTNGWTCLPDDPSTPADDPVCMDRMAMEWVGAWMSRQEPKIPSPGIGYMLQGGGSASNTDPFAKKPAAGEKWMKEPPHLMIFPAWGTKLDRTVYGTDMHSGGPWIMWGGTPYEHLMVPVK